MDIFYSRYSGKNKKTTESVIDMTDVKSCVSDVISNSECHKQWRGAAEQKRISVEFTFVLP